MDTVAAGSLAVAVACAWRHRKLPTGDANQTSARLPQELERGYDFLPGTEGMVARTERAAVQGALYVCGDPAKLSRIGVI